MARLRKHFEVVQDDLIARYLLLTHRHDGIRGWDSALSHESLGAERRLIFENCYGKLGSIVSQISAENRIKPWSATQSQAKRINEIALR